MDIYSDVSSIKGVGPKKKELLEKCCIFNILDLLLYFPRDYENIYLCKDLRSGSNNKVIIKCKVLEIKRDYRTRSGKILSTIIFSNGENIIKGKWFNQPYIKKSFKINNNYTVIGKIQEYRGEINLLNAKVINNAYKVQDNSTKIVPKYPLKAGLKNNTIVKLIQEILSKVHIEENLPKGLIDKYKLCSLDKAIRNIHNPLNMKELREARKRLKFQELFTYSLKVLMLKYYLRKNIKGISFQISSELKILKNKLPFLLTKSQSKVIREILIDEKKPFPMNRLVQGDVGSGKTIVAIITMFNVVKNGYQTVLMAPTEILAIQHFNEINNILKDFHIKVELLSGSTTDKNKKIIKQNLREGKIDIIVGTHALIEDDVEFKNLGMVVTDEQHRFGVLQRNKLFNKGNNADVLVMTATPIPRTLALYLYGDLDVSIIDELPPGRQSIETSYVKSSEKDKVYRFALKQINLGRQIYIVCPLVEDKEDTNLVSVENLYNSLKEKYFSEISMAILHGKMNGKEKKEVMDKFKNNEIKVLVSTTVIEVGVNVPNASLMIIENAERFGLAQLHQLRGRVGRGKYKSYCILIANINTGIIKRRLDIMKNSSDGFYISEEDFKIRGSGEIFGYKQHGDKEFILSNIIEDIDLFKLASFEAKKLIHSKKEDDIILREKILKNVEETSKFICFN
ncbi:ATP-dependent DNA helicase RecG [Clostridium acetireducens DSM 10703]|uniref:ATP-dependent DNA helicase RecG n=1 Tax=Clostridium acetireducens DSM 10703 TaxID=1121290 RepID=A0A1E8F204_9CLOT|nr:ATP-dependent DNA helicase RecG [Clostridium acetireducens]OFI07682.1 ATP-dependent DNA helicase RecG [Clostridium acetireducens DSM 10703]